MLTESRISRIADGIRKESDGKFHASFKIKSEDNEHLWYDVDWNKYEQDLHKAFRCECTSWRINANRVGLCKHTIALCKVLSNQGKVPRYWYAEAFDDKKAIISKD